MAKRKGKRGVGRIPYMGSWTQVDGTIRYRWAPSPRLRRDGWVSRDLGTEYDAAVLAAMRLNREVEEAALVAELPANVQPKRPPRRATFGDLVHEFRQHMDERAALPRDHEDHLTVKTCSQYRTQLRWLNEWADRGETPLDQIDVDICRDLRQMLVNNATAWNAAARLRMLRQLLGFAASSARRWIKMNPMEDDSITIPTPKPRQKRAAIEAVEWLADFARTFVQMQDDRVVRQGGPNLALAVLLGFYTTQREEDLLAATRMAWRPIDDVDHYDRATLSLGGNGELFALRIHQEKTGKWVTCFLPPDVAAMLDALIQSRGAGWDGPLLQADDRTGPERHWPEWEFQRTYRAMRDAAVVAAQKKGDPWLVDQLDALQYRDMRRSGMCWLRDMGVQTGQIAIISGHSIAYTLKILDTYMPGDARGAAAGLAAALRTRTARPKKERKS